MPNTTRTQLPARPHFPELEEGVLEHWKAHNTFQTSVDERPPENSYVFYDGPPFATGMPHYGHLLASTVKDVIPRYWTMKQFRVERRWGWDCHGLPIENMIEQKLEIKGGKKGIENLGIAVFNSACRTEVLRLDTEWEKVIDRLGRWVDFEHNYKTMDTSFMESVWWGFSQLYAKGLVYEGRKVVLYCARCATPLSNFEIAMDNSYADTQDNSLFLKFRATDTTEQEFFLAWTTTPWTLPGNVALAINPSALYSKVRAATGELYWLAETLRDTVLQDTAYELVETVPGEQLLGRSYQPLYDYIKATENKKAWTILPAEFVSLEDGTGIVHTAAVFGEDDYALALEHDLPTVPTLDEQGMFLPFVSLVAGKFFKKAEQPIIDDLQQRQLVLRAETITHSYPFCYRCATPLFYNAVPAWFIDIQQLKPQLIARNEQINWFPAHLKHGRFGKGLETAPDWNISRSRYWGTPMPVWTSEDGQRRVIGSLAELREWAVDSELAAQVTDIHREFIDDIELWVDDARTVRGRRIPEVFDCWVESGSMPFAAQHYPFENKEQFEKRYPAQFVSEYIAQTRAWFYTMHVLSVALFGKPPFENVLTTGTILAEDGSKMSKSKKNYPDPSLIINEYGADSLRLYLMSSPVMKGENLNFSEKDVSEIRKRVLLIWWNMLSFYSLYAKDHQIPSTPPEPAHVLDQWVLSRLSHVTNQVSEYMDAYDVVRASRLLMEFVTELSTWYLRRSRDRLRDAQNTEALDVFGYVLLNMSLLFAPFAPFFAEWTFQFLRSSKQSVHLEQWPSFSPTLLRPDLEESMTALRQAVEHAHAARSSAGIKVRQPLAQLSVIATVPKPTSELLSVLADEVNVKQVEWIHGTEGTRVTLDTHITPELAAEGEARECMREIQKLRKQAKLAVGDHAVIELPSWPESWRAEIESKTNSTLAHGEALKLREPR